MQRLCFVLVVNFFCLWHAGHVQAAMNALEAGFFGQEGLDVEVVHAKINPKGIESRRYFSCSCDDHFCAAYRRSMKPLRSSSESGPGSMNSAGLR
jgi:hypothetical protein